ncbi:hypothetical protein ZWY2020_004357 [Hordeum vulgare]|nr:hypothetical protein ZWY2020_004357 [Hordeum vulgare]
MTKQMAAADDLIHPAALSGSKCMDYDRVVRNPFPRLVELRLHLCSVSLGLLRGVIDAAPLLATLHLG